MKEQDNYNNIITNQSNNNSLSLTNDNNDKSFSNNIQLNNFNQIQSNLNANLNINNLVSLAQNSNLNNNNNHISYDNNLIQNVNIPNINEFPLIEEIKNNLNNQNNNIYNNQNNNIYNFNNNFFNNNNYFITGNNNKGTKPYFTSKHVLLNAHSLDEINDSINKDLFQLEKFLPNYKNYIGNNNSESIYICLKYIEYTNFFFNQVVTNKVNDLLKEIIYSDNNNYGNIDNQNNEIFIIKKKIKDLYSKLIPFDFRINYLNQFYEKNCDKKLYNLFKNDLNKYQRYNDKKYYLYEIFEIVKQKMDNKDKEEIKNYFHKIFYNSKNPNNNINLFLVGNNNMNNDKNGGNYTNNYNNYHNNNAHHYRKYSYQSPNSKNNNANYNNYENNTYNNNVNNYHHNFNNNRKNNYNDNLNEDNDNNMGYKATYDNNNNHHHNSAFQKKNNNYKGSYSSRHYYNNNNNKNNNIRNKGNRKNSAYNSGGVLVEVDSTPKITENDNNSYVSNKEETDINANNEKKEEIFKGNDKNENEIENEENTDNNDVLHKNENNIINNEEIDLENNLNINKENSLKENIHIIEEDHIINKSIDNLEMKDENLSSNSINPFHENVTSSEENSVKEESNNQLSFKNNQNYNADLKINNSMDNNIENNINNQEDNQDLIDIINKTQNNVINSALYNNDLNHIENEQQNNSYQYNIEQIEDIKKDEDIKNENNINNNNKSLDITPKRNSMSDTNIQKIKINMTNNTNNNNLTFNDIGPKNNFINHNNNHNSYNNTINNNNLTNEQLQLLKLMMFQNNNLLMNINPFYNPQPIKPNQSNTNLNNFQINNNNNINTNFNNLNLLNNINQKINLLNNNYYYPNNYQNYNTIFFNYWNEENNLISNLMKNNSSNNHSSNYNNNMNYINKKSEKLSIEYNKIKKIEKENPEIIKEFMGLFEEKLILPIYAKINEENQIKKEFYTEIYNKYKNIILAVFAKHNLENTIKVEPFGSIVNNFMTEWGDIDICIIPNDNNLIQSFWEYLEEIKEEVITVQQIAKFVNIERYPRFLILKLKDIETNIDLDITIQNKLPILNTKLIRLYSLLDQRFHILGIFLKFWVKKNKIHSAFDKFLSSYALLILIIHYLQNITEPKILPILQQIQNIQKVYTYYYEDKELKTNLYFEEDLDKIKNYMNIINDKKENNNSIVELLIGFFEFYAFKYNHYLISISRSDKKPVPEGEMIAFPLEDPFDVNYNPGKSMKLNTLQYSAFIYCMKKELNNILSGEYFKFVGGE